MDSPLERFDFTALDDPSFKEDAVREEIVAPLLWAIGFAAVGPATIKRTKPLEHPYVSIGSVKRKISIFPDYILEFSGKVACVVEAKAPSEDIMNVDHLSQAYTYAIHRAVKAEHYALCNGRRFVLFAVEDMSNAPVLDFQLNELPARWPEIRERLAPHRLTKAISKLAKDFGLHLERIGLSHELNMIFPSVPIFQIARSDDDLYSIMANAVMEEQPYAASFDFTKVIFEELARSVPHSFAERLREALANWPTLLSVGSNSDPIRVNIAASLSTKLVENSAEIFRPLIVSSFPRSLNN